MITIKNNMLKNNMLALGSTFLVVLSACNHSAGTSTSTSDAADTSANAPVETEDPNSDYKPAFAGQTRAPGVKTTTPYSVTLIDSTLKRPWGIALLPDGRFLITQKEEGSMRLVSPDGKSDKTITGLPAVVADGQGGLLDVIADPDFGNNRMVFWDYSERTPDGLLILAVAKGKLSDDETKIENPTVIYRATPAFKGAIQFGSRIVFDKEGNLFISTGERSDPEIRVQAQQLNSALGKIVHITKDGKPVPNGPFANTPDARPEVYALGFRSPEGLAWNPETGELWESEFGPRGGDEINIIRPGKNYGWPVITYGIEYSGKKVGDSIQVKEGMEQPIYYWDPVISPSGITFYNGDAIPEWKGNLFISSLSRMHVNRVVIKDNKVVGEERLLTDLHHRFRAIREGKDGALYTVTDEGQLYKIAKK